MPLWTLNNKPTWAPDAIATEKGWENPVTGEVLVAIGQLEERRHDYLEGNVNNILCEDGSFFLLEQQLGDEGPDFLILET